MPYSVSPRRIDQSLGPKPTKYSVAFMPDHFAVKKWPSSWSIMITISDQTTATHDQPAVVPRSAVNAVVPRTSAARRATVSVRLGGVSGTAGATATGVATLIAARAPSTWTP